MTEGRLNIDQNQKKQAENESQAATAVLPRAARECFRWLLCPVQDDPKAERPAVESFPLNTSSETAGGELERVCRENELVIEAWSPIHLRAKLKELYWKTGRSAVAVAAFWEDSIRYLYLPRLKTRAVLTLAVRSGVGSRDFFGTAYGEAGGKFEGFHFGDGDVSVDDTLLLIEPEATKEYAIAQKKIAIDTSEAGPSGGPGEGGETTTAVSGGERSGKSGNVTPAKAKSFLGTADVPAATAKMKLVQIADEIVSLLASDPNATIRVTVEIAAEFPSGVSDTIKRAVSENATSLGFKTKDWE